MIYLAGSLDEKPSKKIIYQHFIIYFIEYGIFYHFLFIWVMCEKFN